MEIRMEGDRPEISMDPESSDYAKNWWIYSRELRQKCPVTWSTEHGGFWVATRYEDVVRIARDDKTFTNGKTFDPETGHVEGGVAIPPMPIGRLIPAEVDGEEWERFRGVLNPRMGPRAAESFRKAAEEFAVVLLDRVIERGEMDLVQEFTNPLTALVMMRLFGFPLEEWRAFSDRVHDLTSLNKNSPEYAGAIQGAEWINKRIREEMARRRVEPQDDMIGYLVATRINGEPMADDDIHQSIINVLFGGVDTTTALVAHALYHLNRHRDQLARLIADRSLLPVAREEFVRFYTPSHGSARHCQADTRIGAHTVAAGEKIFAWFASANRDAEVFDNPDEINIDRFPNRHVGFGSGIHRCIGSFFARMMFDTLMNTVFDRIPDYEVIEDTAELYPTISPINGWVKMRIKFTPGPRLRSENPEWMKNEDKGGH